MNLSVILRTLGVLSVLFSTVLIPPLALAWLDHDGFASSFGETAAIFVLVGLGLWLPLRKAPMTIRTRDGFVIVALMWTFTSLIGAVPFVVALDMDFVDAFFESASGYTTTGSTVMVGLDELPRSILLYRQETQWLGGIGVVVLAIALLPMLGIGGMQLYKAETPGPFKDDRLTPRLARTAKSILLIYLGLTVLCAFAYWIAGMGPFDAIAHSLSTLSTGGYSTHDASIGFFDNPWIETVAIVFMVAGSVSFSTHFVALRTLRGGAYTADTQIRAFVGTIVVMSVIFAFILRFNEPGTTLLEDIRITAFEVVSVASSTGFGIADFSVWPLALPVLLIFISFVGGCAGSTAGGMKVIRFVVLGKQAGVHILRLVHPKAVWPVKVDDRVVPDHVVEGIWGFFTVYVVVFLAFMVALMMDGMDQVTAFSAVATTLNNLGPGLGTVAQNFVDVPDESKLLLVFAMLFGRLEIFTPLVLLTPSFWKR
jgi:trk system potassium uptake protein TrkH